MSYLKFCIEKKYRPVAEWVTAGGGWVPPGEAVTGGFDVSGENIYVGRAQHEGEVIPGKVVASHGCCYVAYGGREHRKEEYQALVDPHGCELIWLHSSNGQVPAGALQGGVTADGEPIYVGRHQHDGSFTIGKVHPSHGCLYIPFGGEEHRYTEYEVLCAKHVPLH
ncbi:uncharacterized protein B4U80_06829 [Leptotrombidium deliense]|uniref:Natterin-3-like protein n=1 Tax=Leptotrombidium deliense TaxID=299467 RepID=A0A443SE60_9ACAR|nr:uncharacterized protein B4U80_06829 [Leptotrombidium deliense]